MQVELPSQGLLGLREVSLELPKYKHVRSIAQLNCSPEMRGIEFVKSLIPSPEFLSRMTIQDKDYLLIIAVSALHLNSIEVSAMCRCGNKVSVVYDITKEEVVDLSQSTPPVVTKEFQGKSYEYHFLSAADEVEIIDYARRVPEEYNNRYMEGYICKVFGLPLSEENVQSTFDYDLTLYHSPLLFREMSFHGVRDFVSASCPKCGEKLLIRVQFAKSLEVWSPEDVVNQYLQVSKYLGFSEFLEMSFSEIAQIRANVKSGAI